MAALDFPACCDFSLSSCLNYLLLLVVLVTEVLESSVGVTSRFPHQVVLLPWHLVAVSLPSGGHHATFCHWRLSRLCAWSRQSCRCPCSCLPIHKISRLLRKNQLSISSVEDFCPQSPPWLIYSLFSSLLEHNEHKNQIAEGNAPCPQSLFPFVLSVLVCKRVPNRNYWTTRSHFTAFFFAMLCFIQTSELFFFSLFVVMVNPVFCLPSICWLNLYCSPFILGRKRIPLFLWVSRCHL